MPLLVVKGSQSPLFGRNWLSRVKLDWKPICSIRVSGAGLPHDVQIQLTNTIQCDPNVFKPGLGVTRGITAKLEKKPDVEPILASPVPFALQEAVGANFINLNPKMLWKRSDSACGQPPWFMSQRLMAPRGRVETMLLLSTPDSTFLSIQFPCLTMSLSSCKGQNDSASLIQ